MQHNKKQKAATTPIAIINASYNNIYKTMVATGTKDPTSPPETESGVCSIDFARSPTGATPRQ